MQATVDHPAGDHTTATPLTRIARIEVEGLFGLYDHPIELKAAERITILHGPNGVGKTMLLRMTHDLLTHDLTRDERALFDQVPFRRFAVTFADGMRLEVTPEPTDEPADEPADTGVIGRRETNGYSLRAFDADQEGAVAEIRIPAPPGLLPLGLEELGARHAPSRAVPSPRRTIAALRDKASIHFISDRRLTCDEADPVAPDPDAANRRSAVLADAEDLRDRIEDAAARYGRRAQELEQSLPHRFLSGGGALRIAELGQRLDRIETTRADYKRLGLLDDIAAAPMERAGLAQIDDAGRRMMTLYVEDALDKLGVLAGLAARMALFLDIINAKFRDKRIRIDRAAGFVAERADGEPLALETLSTGEQHELVMHYHLLFRVPEDALVLIDEPELSLHIDWQDRFLPDLFRIIAIAKCDVLIATHSPYIVGEHPELMVPLDPEAA